MPKKARELTALEVRRLTWNQDTGKPALHSVGGVSGLMLQCRPPVSDDGEGAKSWILRTTIAGKRRDMGLGSFGDVTLAQAKQAAREIKAAIREGRDPLSERKQAKQALAAEQAKAITFREAAIRYISTVKAPVLKNPKHLAQWGSTLETYAFPTIGSLPVSMVETSHIVSVLSPIWTEKTETATRLRGRIENILDWAIASGFRDSANPATRGVLKDLLPSAGRLKKAKAKHHAALPVHQMHEFMFDLRERDGVAPLALEFAILTASRSAEVRLATWQEIDLKKRLWTIPADRMKAGRAHVVPLSNAAVSVLAKMPRLGELIFTRDGSPLSENALTSVIKRMGRYTDPSQGDARITAHGFRSTFADWARTRTGYPDEVSELCLAHVSSDATRAAYKRDMLLPQRTKMMAQWADFIDTPAHDGDVISFRGAAQ